MFRLATICEDVLYYQCYRSQLNELTLSWILNSDWLKYYSKYVTANCSPHVIPIWSLTGFHTKAVKLCVCKWYSWWTQWTRLCVQTEHEGNFRGSEITFKVNGKTWFDGTLPEAEWIDRKIHPLSSKCFSLSKTCTLCRALWICFINSQRYEGKENDWREITGVQSEAELNTNTQAHSHTQSVVRCWRASSWRLYS